MDHRISLKTILLPAIVAACLILPSCSEDTPSEPVVTPAVQIEVLTVNPETGVPVEFKATVTGGILTSPTYEWDFGDGSEMIVSDEDTVSHIFYDEGDFTVLVRCVDTVTSVSLTDSITVHVVDNRPLWRQWNSVTVSLFSTMKGLSDHSGVPDSLRQLMREDYLLSYTVEPLLPKAFDGQEVVQIDWSEYSVDYHKHHMINQYASYTLDLQIGFSSDYRRIDSLILVDKSGSTGSAAYGNEVIFSLVSLNSTTPLLADSCVYRASGIPVADHIELFKDFKWSRTDPGYTYDTIVPNPDMYIEVRFYKK